MQIIVHNYTVVLSTSESLDLTQGPILRFLPRCPGKDAEAAGGGRSSAATWPQLPGRGFRSHGGTSKLPKIAQHLTILEGCEIVLGIFFWAGLGIFLGFLGWYHLPSVCNGLELEFVILHGICHIWACSPSILHGIYYMWACSPSILYGICHILACSPSILHGISYMWACSPSILYGICHILACSPSILHGMFYMWACSPKYLQMRKLGIR